MNEFLMGIFTPADTEEDIDIQLQLNDDSSNHSLVSLNIMKDPTHLPAAQLINDIDEISTPRIKKKKSTHVEEKTRAKTRAGMFSKHITTKEVKVSIERNNNLENRVKNKKNFDQYDEDDGDNDDNTGSMNSNHDHQPASSHEFRYIANPEYEKADGSEHNNGDFNEEDSNSGSEYSFDLSSCGTINSITYDEDDGDVGNNTGSINSNHDHQPASSHEFRYIASPEYEKMDGSEHNNRDVNEEDPNSGSEYFPDKSQSGTSQSSTDDDNDYNDGYNMRNMVSNHNSELKSSHDSQSIASPEYEEPNPNEDNNTVTNEGGANSGSQAIHGESPCVTTEFIADDNDDATLILISDNESDIGNINLSQSLSSVLPADTNSDVTIFSDADELQPSRPTSSNGRDSDGSIIFEGWFPKENMQTSTYRTENNSSPSLL